MSEVEIKAKQYVDYLFEGEFETPVLMFKKADIRVAYMQGFEDATKWHYPSKGEYPISGADVWDGYRVLSYLIDLKKWVYDCEFEVSEPRCWCYLPEPPKEEAE